MASKRLESTRGVEVVSGRALKTTFGMPPDSFRPIPTWWWCGERVTPERVEWQLRELHAGGIREVMVCDLGTYQLGEMRSDDPPLFSEEWWRCFIHAATVAEDLGMRLWFWDHLGVYPSSVPEQIMHAHPEFVGRELLRIPAGGLLPQGADVVRDDSDWVYYTLPLPFSHAIVRPLGIDFYNPLATHAVIDALHGEYERRLGERFGRVIAGTFQDELHPFPSWAEELPAIFLRYSGRPFVDCLPALFEGSVPDPRARISYHRALASLAEEHFFKLLYKWHTERGLLLVCDQFRRARMGDPVDAQRSYHDYLRTHRWVNGIGNDHNGETKVHSSLAHLYGLPRVMLEGFHSSGYGATLEECLHWVLPWLQQGVTLWQHGGMNYNTLKAGWLQHAALPPDWRQPYWRHYSVLAESVARLCWLFSQGTHVCDVAVLYPTSSVQAELTVPGCEYEDARAWLKVWIVYTWTPEVPAPTPELGEIARVFWEITGNLCWRWQGRMYRDDRRPWIGALERAGCDFDVMDEDSLERASCRQGKLNVAGESYSTLILPRITHIPRQSLRQVLQFVESGGRVVFVERVPHSTCEGGADDAELTAALKALGCLSDMDGGIRKLESIAHARGGMVYLVPTAADVVSVLSEGASPDVSGEVRALHRRANGLDLYLIVPKQLAPPPPEREGRLWRLMGQSDAEALVEQVRQRAPVPDQLVVTVRRTGPVTQWDPRTGDVYQACVLSQDDSTTTVRLDLSSAPVGVLAFGDVAGAVAPLAPATTVLTLPDEWECALVQTQDNQFGDFAWPLSQGAPPVEVRKLEYMKADEADSIPQGGWQPIICGYVPGVEIAGPLPNRGPEVLDLAGWRPYLYSTCFGPLEDIGSYANMGLLGMVPSDFIAFGFAEPGRYYFARTNIIVPHASLAKLRIISNGAMTAWLNAEEVGSGNQELCIDVRLHSGANALLLRIGATDDAAGRGFLLRAGFHVLDAHARPPYGHTLPDVPDWLNCVPPEDAAARLAVAVPRGLQEGKAAPWLPGVAFDPHPMEKPRRGWFRCVVPPGADHVTLEMSEQVRVSRALLEAEPLALDWAEGAIGQGSLSGTEKLSRRLFLYCEMPLGMLPGSAFKHPVRFHCGRGSIQLGDWREMGLSCYSGGLKYSQSFALDSVPRPLWLDLGRVRGSVEVSLNGQACGVRSWHPYRFELTAAAAVGTNHLQVTVFNTLGALFGEGHPSVFAYPSQAGAGIMGPVCLRTA